MFPAKLIYMKKMTRFWQVVVTLLGVMPVGAYAQDFAAPGTRAAGMAGAFVGVADDASAIYWNPAGLAAGSYFSLVLDAGLGKAVPDGSLTGGEHSSAMVALAMPALGLGYYRLHSQTARPPVTLVPVEAALSSRNLSAVGEVRLDSLITHHAGVTLVQSLLPGVAVGTTLKYVRGIATSQRVPASSAEAALDGPASEVLGRASNQFDLDVGIMAAGGPLKVGLALRNLTEPAFATPEEGELVLERQARAGVSYAVTPDWLAAADFDLTRSEDAFGERRDIALGVEGRLTRSAVVRSGVRFNTLDDPGLDDARGTSVSVGGSYAVRGSLFIDGQLTAGGDRGGRGWGIAARFVY